MNNKSIFKGIYNVIHLRADKEKADCYEKLMKLPEGISAQEIAKLEKTIISCDKLQSYLYYRAMNKELPPVMAAAYQYELDKRDRIIGGYPWCLPLIMYLKGYL